jgi:hypothetical protein
MSLVQETLTTDRYRSLTSIALGWKDWLIGQLDGQKKLVGSWEMGGRGNWVNSEVGE